MLQFPYIVTGATGGVGAAAVERLVSLNHPVLMACRNLSKAEKVKDKVLKKYPDALIDICELELSSLQSVANFVEVLKENHVQPSGLLNNAGTLPRFYGLTKDGFEMNMGVNYLSTYLLTRLLLPILRPGASIVNTVSISRVMTNIDRKYFEMKPSDFSQLETYAKSKIAVYLFTVELAKRVGGLVAGTDYANLVTSNQLGSKVVEHERAAASCAEKIRVNATDPGVVNSDMLIMHRWFDPLAAVFFRPFTKPARRAAIPAVNALTSGITDEYFHGVWHRPFYSRYVNHPCGQWLWYATEAKLREMGFGF